MPLKNVVRSSKKGMSSKAFMPKRPKRKARQGTRRKK